RISTSIHNTYSRPASVCTRMKHYELVADALADGMRLSEAMSLKFASVGFPHGGGKAVIALPSPAIPEGESRRRLLHEYGRFIDSLGGLYSCAPDMNTSAADMDVIADMTSYVFCKTEAAGGSGDTAPDTAVGVLHGIRASCRHAFGSDDLSRRSILVQGAGGVGGRLIELLTEADATVIATDIDPARLAILRDKGIQVVEPDTALTTPCDVLAPCAAGGRSVRHRSASRARRHQHRPRGAPDRRGPNQIEGWRDSGLAGADISAADRAHAGHDLRRVHLVLRLLESSGEQNRPIFVDR